MHDNHDVSDVERFNYLKGPAASAIEGISLKKEDYQAAIKLLKVRLANLQLVMSSYMDALLKLRAVEDINDLMINDIRHINDIRSLFDKIET